MEKYESHRPTCFDLHIPIDSDDESNREDWLLVPVSRNRDSGPLDNSNFETALASLGGESEDVEVHRFGHWGPGWYEIIIVKPGSEAEKTAEDIERSLEDYPVLDDRDFSNREHENFIESWDNWAVRDFRRELLKAFIGTIKEQSRDYAEYLIENAPGDELRRYFMDVSINPYVCEDSGVLVNVESTIKRDIDADSFKDYLHELHALCVLDYANGYQW